jgi:hypothetical protein
MELNTACEIRKFHLHVRTHDALIKKLVVQPKTSTRKITGDQVSSNEFISSGARLREQNMDSQLRFTTRVQASYDKGDRADQSCDVVAGCSHDLASVRVWSDSRKQQVRWVARG